MYTAQYSFPKVDREGCLRVMAKPTWDIFLGALAGVIVFVVPIVLYLMEKANKKISWIFIVGLISVGIAAVYLVLNIPWAWSASSTAWKVYRACMLSSFALLAVGYFGIWVWPEAKITANENGSPAQTSADNTKPQEPTSDKKEEDKKKEGGKNDAATPGVRK
jgi:hypothetical protein